MHRAFAANLLSTLLMALGTARLAAQAPTPDSGKPLDAAKPAKGTSAPGSAFDKLKLPPGGVVIVVQQVKDALAMVPKMVLLAPEEYQKLLDRLSLLEKKLNAEKKNGSCLQAQRTHRRRLRVRARGNCFCHQSKQCVRLSWFCRRPIHR